MNGLTKKVAVSRTSFYQYFDDRHNLIEELLNDLARKIDTVAEPWFTANSDITIKLCDSLYGAVTVCYHRGPILRAIVEAAPMDELLENVWYEFVKTFDDAVATRIARDQRDWLAPRFDPHPVAIALNRMDKHVRVFMTSIVLVGARFF